MRLQHEGRIQITLDELLTGGILSSGQKLRIFNADHPMGRNGTHYLLATYPVCQPPTKYVYELDEKGSVKYEYDLDSDGNKIPLKNSQGNVRYEYDNGEYLVDENGNKKIMYRKRPITKGLTKKYQEYLKFCHCLVSHIYCEEFYDEYGRVKETGLAIHIFGGNR